jgi:hypothetical protein
VPSTHPVGIRSERQRHARPGPALMGGDSCFNDHARYARLAYPLRMEHRKTGERRQHGPVPVPTKTPR